MEKKESLKEVQHGKHENVAGAVWLNLFMDGSLPSTPHGAGFSRIHIKHELVHLRFFNICECVHMTVIMELSMWYIIAILWKAAFCPQVCALNENTMTDTK
jgi:hypothetical protein